MWGITSVTSITYEVEKELLVKRLVSAESSVGIDLGLDNSRRYPAA